MSANQKLTGDALTNALKGQNWDPSVQALIPFPRVLQIMSTQLEWTQQLGNAFLAQQSDVMDSVQRLRHAALAAGTLKTTPECHCTVQTAGDTISILPVEPQLACVPVYNPNVAFGAWPAPDYPPFVFPLPIGFGYAPGQWIGFGPPIELAAFGPLWGWSSFDWWGHRILVDNRLFGRFAPGHPGFAGGVWVHDPAHRRGVAYASPAAEAHFGAASRAASVGAFVRAGPVTFGGRFGALHPHVVSGSHFAGHPASPSGVGHFQAGAFHGGPSPHSRAAPVNFAPSGHTGGAPHGAAAPHGGGFHR